MSALNLILDAAVRQLAEPGFWRFVSNRALKAGGNPSDDASAQGIWQDEPTETLMLRPLQLESSWLNTAAPLSTGSIIRMAQMSVNAVDLTSTAIFEAPVFGNADNPYVFHVPAGPAGAFPGHAEAGEFPGSAPSLVGIPVPINPAANLLTVPTVAPQGPSIVYTPSVTLPAPPPTAPPTLIEIGDTGDGKFLAQSARMPANQPLFFRWFHPSSMLGFPCTYEFYVGQFKLRIKDVVVEIWQDTSPNGDRSAWNKIMIAPLFSVGDLSPTGTGSLLSVIRPQAVLAHDRSLLWIPFRRNQVLLYSSAGKYAVLTVRPAGQRLPDGSDWDIVRADTLIVWVLTPAPGRFQIQQVLYPSGTIKVQSPTTTLDYTPGVSPTITISGDTDHGTTLSATESQPPSYTIPANSANDCPPTTTLTGDQRRTYGVELSLAASSDHRWTPFFYGYQIFAARTFVDSPATPATVVDTSPGAGRSALLHATMTSGLEPGEGRFHAEVIDYSTYPLTPFYYRCSMPIQLTDPAGPTPLFTGITAPTELTPFTLTGTEERKLTFSAVDRWKALADTYLRDQRDWTGSGHIDVVRAVCELGGVDCTSAEFPAGYTAGVIGTLNSALGGPPGSVAQQSKDLKQGWAPRDDDTAATYIKRVQDLYSGWYAGFRLDGTFYYLPKTYFTSVTTTFHDNNAAGSPRFFNPVTFTTVEPEANVIVVKAGNAVTGAVAYSSVWIDWASIKTPAAVNYLGRWRAEVVEIGGTFSCAQLNWMARVIWSQTRRRFIHATFEAEFVPALKIGQVFTLGSYGNYRLIGMHVKFENTGVHRAAYTGELVEAGV